MLSILLKFVNSITKTSQSSYEENSEGLAMNVRLGNLEKESVKQGKIQLIQSWLLFLLKFKSLIFQDFERGR